MTPDDTKPIKMSDVVRQVADFMDDLTEKHMKLRAAVREAVDMLSDEPAHWGEAIRRLRELLADG